MRKTVWIMLYCTIMLSATGLAEARGTHPLDPLSGAEIRAVVSAVLAANRTSSTVQFPLITLAEPDKAEVLAWRPGQVAHRKAFVVARRDGMVYEGTVDLSSNMIEAWRPVPGVQSSILDEEVETARKLVRDDAAWQSAMQRHRGYSDFGKIFCAPLAAGSTGDAEADRRLLKVVCFNGSGGSSLWARPIEGLLATVDVDAGTVTVTDSGPVPVADDKWRMQDLSRQVPPGRRRGAPADFRVEGHEVHWHHWSLHYGFDRRAGLIVWLVRYNDGGRERLVLYRGSLAELFVPYMDGAPGWAFRAFLDEGEYGFGALSSELRRGIDCPADATFLDAVLPSSHGEPLLGKSVICLFERETGAPLWRHAENYDGTYQARPATELVMRTIPSIGNYDYIIDWVLTDAGTIRIDAGASGIDAVKGVGARSMNDAGAATDTTTGNLIAPGRVGVNHDHFLSFRLDVDIDGAANTLVRERLVDEPATAASGGRSLWHPSDENIVTEGPLGSDAHGGAELWRVINPNLVNSLGEHPGYELRLGHIATSRSMADDRGQRRGAFSAAPLWVTPYAADELYAAGPYPNQSKGSGLGAPPDRQRRVENTDIVLWCTLGFHHVTRPEDWPILPTMWHGLSLVPYGFFDHNPAIEPRSAKP
jgi:primary-amine oxidase